MRLKRVDPGGPGINRRRHGGGFSYRDPAGQKITDEAVLERIRRLAVPPAWRDVWICPDPSGHIQAIGTDDAGRRQYLYHEEWRRQRDEEKFARVARLGRRMPAVRGAVEEHLAGRGLSRQRVLAAAVRMLDLGVFRVGGEQYAPADDDDEDDGTFGLATIRREHVRSSNGTVTFDYPAKGGARRTITLHDAALCNVVRALLRRRAGGPELLAYRTDRSTWHDVSSAEINQHIKELAGDEFTAKDVRTWNATVCAAIALAEEHEAGPLETKRATALAVNSALDRVAEQLGNTRAVTRSSYVAPRVVLEFEKGGMAARGLRLDPESDQVAEDVRDLAERAVLRTLDV